MLPRIAALVVACAALTGCGTVVRGTTEDVRIIVEPEDAAVTTSLGHRCNAMPCTVKVARRDKFTVTASKQGYITESVDVGTKVSGGGAAGFAGNIVVGGVVGMGVDVATGAALDHTPNPVVIKLQPEGAEPATAEPVRPSPKTRPRRKDVPVS